MKRSLAFITALMVSAALTLSAAANSGQMEPDRYEAPNDLSGVTLSVKQDTATDTGLVLIVDNQSNVGLNFGTSYEVEEFDDIWCSIPTTENEPAWDAAGYFVPAGQTRELEINWMRLYGPLWPGEFRIIMECTAGQGETLKKYYFTAEFAFDDDKYPPLRRHLRSAMIRLLPPKRPPAQDVPLTNDN